MRLLRALFFGGINVNFDEPKVPKDINLSVVASTKELCFSYRAISDEERNCIWLNPGLRMKDGRTELSKDPELGLVKIVKAVVSGNSINIKYRGVVKPLLVQAWGSSPKGRHILRPSTLWYPYTFSYECLVWPCIVGRHERALLEVEIINKDLCSVSSLKLVENGIRYSMWKGEHSSPIELIISNFRIKRSLDLFDGHINLFSELGLDANSFLNMTRHVGEFYDNLGLENPIKELNVAVIKGGGGFRGGYLLCSDARHLTDPLNTVANILHEYAHTWWGTVLHPRDPQSIWLTEAIPEYLTIIGLEQLGRQERAKALLMKHLHESRSVRRSLRYVPPTAIHMPLTKRGEAIHRSVGVAILHEIREKIGLRDFISVLTNYTNRSLKRGNFAWEELFSRYADTFKGTIKILKKYKLRLTSFAP